MSVYPEFEHAVIAGDTFDTLAKYYYNDKHAANNLTLYNHLKNEDQSSSLIGKLKTVRVPEKLRVYVGRCLNHTPATSDTFESIAEKHYGSREAAVHIKRLCGLSAEKPSDNNGVLFLPKNLDEYTLQTALTNENSDKAFCLLLYPRVQPETGNLFSFSL